MKEQMEQEWVDTDNTKEREILDLRLINMQSALTLGRFRYLRAAAPLKAQCHDHWMVLLFVLSGKQFIIIDDREIVIRGGEMARVLPGQKYSSGSYPEQRGEVAVGFDVVGLGRLDPVELQRGFDEERDVLLVVDDEHPGLGPAGR